mmetsp:Transcript_24814/g.69512  ORF Transcript_24814/g.69512 Transcript_24814/m.69512 type:complete len:535 (-) Transcript_24814:1634-3238(-)
MGTIGKSQRWLGVLFLLLSVLGVSVSVLGDGVGSMDSSLWAELSSVGLVETGPWSDSVAEAPLLSFFLRDMEPLAKQSVPLHNATSWISDVRHYRLLPYRFPEGMEYHFDGLASVLSFTFSNGELTYFSKAFDSNLNAHYRQCLFYGTGTGPTVGFRPCFKNPVVNLLPLKGELWLTIDSVLWGRLDPRSLETIPAGVNISTVTLNAHPACDTIDEVCYVQYPCNTNGGPYSSQACVSALRVSDDPADRSLQHSEIGRVDRSGEVLIQHSHSPCITPRFVVSKLDQFQPRGGSPPGTGGLLRTLQQSETDEWLVLDRETGAGRVVTSEFAFINNHFTNCYETETDIVVDTIPATSDYLDSYFDYNLANPPKWGAILGTPKRCRIPLNGTSRVSCSELLDDPEFSETRFDYPTFNPTFKMNPDYQYLYLLGASSPAALWFDTINKVDVQRGKVERTWHEDDVFVTEASYVPRDGDPNEDSGVLLSVLYNSTADSSELGIFSAASLEKIDSYPLPSVVPFHAHGMTCDVTRCYPNP